jgi:hypothetical protein
VETHRALRDRTVYVGETRQDKPIHDASATSSTHHGRSRLGALSRHEPYSPLAGTVLRPLGDAATTMQILFRR